MLKAMHPDEIGGGKVLQTFVIGGERVYAGKQLTREQIIGMRPQNRNALIEKNYMTVWPMSAMKTSAPERPRKVQRHIIHHGFSKYSVVEGEIINDKPLTREAADRLAGLSAAVVKRKSA